MEKNKGSLDGLLSNLRLECCKIPVFNHKLKHLGLFGFVFRHLTYAGTLLSKLAYGRRHLLREGACVHCHATTGPLWP